MAGKERNPKSVVPIIPNGAKRRLHKPQTYVVSASMGKGRYRHIRISASDTLENLHGAILDAFGFADDHAHAFFLDNHLWSNADSYFSSDIKDADRFTKDTPLDRVGLRPRMAFKYVFDFGQEWAFQLKLLSVLEEPTNAPQVIRSVGEAPLQYGKVGEAEESSEELMAYPEIYPSRKLKALYKSLALPAETVALLHRYFDAFAQLYGILPLQKALDIYNQQNAPLDEQSFSAFSVSMAVIK